MKKVFNILIFLCATVTIAQDTYILKGTIKNVPNIQIKLVEGFKIPSAEQLGSVLIKDGSFSFSGLLDGAKTVSLIFQTTIGDAFYFIPLVLDKGETVIVADVEQYIINPNNTHTLVYPTIKTASKLTKDYQSFVDKQLALMTTKQGEKVKALSDDYQNTAAMGKEPSEDWYIAYQAESDLLGVQFINLRVAEAKRLSSTMSGMFVLSSGELEVLGPEDMRMLRDAFKKELSSTPEYKTFSKNINDYLGVTIGAIAPDFTLINPEGEKISLSDFKGKHVLIDFWTFWCGPCIAEFPHLEKLRKKYEAEGFEILAVHGDTNKSEWLEALKKHKPSWPQTFDANAFSGTSVSDTYRISAFPSGFLIDPSGKIIGKDL